MKKKMGKGNRSGFMGLGSDEERQGSLLECDVGLGLKVQPTEAFYNRGYCREMMGGLPQFSPYHHHHHPSSSSECISMGTVGFDGGGGGGVGPSYSSSNSRDRISCVSDIYDFVGAPELPRTLRPFTADSSSFKSSGGGIHQVAFTGVQRQELERQTLIYRYMIASMPVPPQLLTPIIKTTPPSSQSNICGLNLRYSSGSDPEPWRCRRTDGKKWRCSRDVIPDHKYCERHARKAKPRSRKPVESQPPHTQTTNTTTTTTTYLNTPNAHQPFQKPNIHFPTMASTATYVDQTRCSEWFMKGDTIPITTLNQQWQQVMPSSSSLSSSRLGLKRDNTDLDKNVSFFQRHYGEEQESLNLNSYMGIGDSQALHNQQLNDPKLSHLQGIRINADRTQRTRHFIDALSSAEREEINEIGNKCSIYSSSGKLPISSSLTLSMSGGNGIDEETENTQMGVGMMDLERESDESFKSQWLNPISWMDSPPGGPLGEALCLGIASTAKTASNLPSPHGYSNSTSSCSKGSYDDCDHGLHFTKRPR